jgi:hypothetical protein
MSTFYWSLNTLELGLIIFISTLLSSAVILQLLLHLTGLGEKLKCKTASISHHECIIYNSEVRMLGLNQVTRK